MIRHFADPTRTAKNGETHTLFGTSATDAQEYRISHTKLNASDFKAPPPLRKKTTRSQVPLIGAIQAPVANLQAVMDRRMAFRLAIAIAEMSLVGERRVASAWFVVAGVQDD